MSFLLLSLLLALFPPVSLPCLTSICVLLHLYFVMLGCYLLEACSILRRDRRGVDLDNRGCGEELVGVEGRETITMI